MGSPPSPLPLVRSLSRLGTGARGPAAFAAAILGAAGGAPRCQAGEGGRGGGEKKRAEWGSATLLLPPSLPPPSFSSSSGPSRALRPAQSGARTSGGATAAPPAGAARCPAPLCAAMPPSCCPGMLPSVPAAACLLLAALLCGGAEAARVNKHKPWIETTYHGIVTENDNTVLLDPPLIALDKDAPLRFAESFEVTVTKEGEICGFKIHGQNVPFEAVVVDKSTGEGIIRSKEKLDCELQKDYTFTIQAYDCGKGPDGANAKKSHKATVHIQVNDVNEYAPVFKEKSYKATAIEGKRYDNILKVEAVDADCSPQFSQICSYEIVTPDVPFAIDKDGYIKNTEKLNYGKEHQYKLTVTAYDCGKKRAAEDVLVKISVKPTCKPGWQGWSKRIEYEPGTGSLALFPGMRLETCDEPITSVEATVELETNHIGKGCDRDTYSEKSIHRLCGAASGTVELLPPPSSAANWTIGLPTDNGHDSDQVFEFNGTQAVKIPDGVVTVNLKEPFMISVWMRHGPGTKEKETILCNSDKTDMNRHHYTLYVHNCRLVFLFRQDPSEGKTYKPAEFHWKLNEVCDKEWHHYVLNVEFPAVTLYVDGVSYDPFPVTEDYPLHPSKIETQLVVGACWQDYTGNENDNETVPETSAGGELHMAQFFRGNLAGLMIRSGKLENKKVIDCLYTCKEGLDLQMADGTGKGVKIHMNPSQSTVSIEGDDIDRVDKAMQHISYLNSRQFPTPGIRRLKITTDVKCFNEDACVSIPSVEGYVMVLQPEEPKISLSGINHFARSASEFESSEGVALFPELRIISTITREVEPEGDGDEDPTVQESLVSEEIMHNLDTCEVTVLGEELNQEQESLEIDMTRLQQKGIEMSSSNLGMIITGVDTMASYEEVLHLIHYRNWHTVSLFDRKFKLVCSELNGRYVSNEFKVEVNVIHTANPVEHANHIAAQPQFVHPVHHTFVDLSGHNLANPHPFSVVPSTATVVIVVCVSFLVFMIILGVFRIRAAHQRTMRDQDTGKENEMDWDDSALTITVNPMETYEDQHSSEEEEEEEEEESEEGEEDDITSAESESSEEEEGEQEEDQQNVNRQQQLEWDDSTLSY
ncbi:calsyntenin-1 isoform X1 [Dryobates pubescens]|uniref:calsyntenin-1 isoform X1 n=1 Tax=Dryobates pubescens TaxID=118200 RepID=UPI0023B96C6D|nr:calsyntenin-1 isoform X1 [Dryobates pubescens]